MVRKDPVTIIDTLNYRTKTVTIRPDKDNQVFTFKQVQDYSKKQMTKLSPNADVLITGLNILRETTLKGYENDFMTQHAYDEYLKGHVEDATKFDKLYNFTIRIRELKTPLLKK